MSRSDIFYEVINDEETLALFALQKGLPFNALDIIEEKYHDTLHMPLIMFRSSIDENYQEEIMEEVYKFICEKALIEEKPYFSIELIKQRKKLFKEPQSDIIFIESEKYGK